MENRAIETIKRFVTGKLLHSEFCVELYLQPEIWNTLQAFLSEEMKYTPRHPIWGKCGCYQLLETNAFKIHSAIMAVGIESIYGQTALHNIASALLETAFPDFKRKRPSELHEMELLDSIGLDCIGRKDADTVVISVLEGIPDTFDGKQYKREAKRRLKKAFHMNGKKPDWVQEPEWPIVNGEPAQFVEQSFNGERPIN